MKYWEALKAAEEGKKVRMSSWNSNMYLYKSNNEEYRLKNYDSYMNIYAPDEVELYADWEIFVEKVTFSKALEALLEGKKITRADNKYDYLCKDSEYGIVVLSMDHTYMKAVNSISVEELLCDSWIILED